MFAYHLVPNGMTGKFLYPLNQMEEVLPDVYSSEVKKYEGREFLMEEIIPELECRWNDVIHLSTVPFDEIYSYLKELGFYMTEVEYYKIPVELIKCNPVVVFKHENPDLTKDQIVSIDGCSEFSEISRGAKDWYLQCRKNNHLRFIFNRIPHVLCQGPIDVSDLEVYKWSP